MKEQKTGKRTGNQKWKEQFVTRPKREAAEKRQEAYNALTLEAKLAKLDAGRFAAVKQRARLLAQQITKPENVITVPEPTKKVRKPRAKKVKANE